MEENNIMKQEAPQTEAEKNEEFEKITETAKKLTEIVKGWNN